MKHVFSAMLTWAKLAAVIVAIPVVPVVVMGIVT